MQKIGALAMFILVTFLVTCNSPTSDADKTMILTVIGTVRNAETGLSIADALIEVTEWNLKVIRPVQSTRTDKNGRYFITIGVSKGQGYSGYDLRASAGGYRTLWWPNEYYQIKKTTVVQTVDFQLVPL